MKFPKFLNKKMVIFFILIIAFIYFSGSLNVMREGLFVNKPKTSTYTPTRTAATATAATATATAATSPATATAATSPAPAPSAPVSSKYLIRGTMMASNMDCCDCFKNGNCSTVDKCNTFFKEHTFTNDNFKCVYDESVKNSYFQPRGGRYLQEMNCSGCKNSPTDPNCNAKCPTDINYADYNCVAAADNNGKYTTFCKSMSDVPDIKQ